MNSTNSIDHRMALLRARFCSTLNDRIKALLDAFDRGDLAVAHAVAHAIAGSAGLFGFAALSEQAQVVSEHCASGNRAAAISAARALGAYSAGVLSKAA